MQEEQTVSGRGLEARKVREGKLEAEEKEKDGRKKGGGRGGREGKSLSSIMHIAPDSSRKFYLAT